MDGNLTNFSHTYYNDGGYQPENSWWQVDLSPGTNTQLNEIKVYNRTDGCGERLQNFTISVIDANGNTVWSEVYNQPTYTGQVLIFYTGNISGEYVRIQKNDANFLHLAEVEVFNVVPAVTRIDPTVNFDWGNQGTPAAGISGANWTASWQGEVTADYTRKLHVLRHRGRWRPRVGQRSVAVRRLELPGRHDLFGHDRLAGRAVVLDPHGLFPGRRGRIGQARMVLRRQPRQRAARQASHLLRATSVARTWSSKSNAAPRQQRARRTETSASILPLVFSSGQRQRHHHQRLRTAMQTSTSVPVGNSSFESPTSARGTMRIRYAAATAVGTSPTDL